ncbi:MAG TPA: TetR/AcrR family transcriptional regulator [Solirubrobacteraceae bacterium]|nr:TetR/AcrR family transcriptional regulator [Solirubrobacteraceae bacterium]
MAQAKSTGASATARRDGRRAGAGERSAGRTREALLAAGVAVAARDGLAGLSVNGVVAEAGVAKGTFYVHFSDREAFVDALHAAFHERVLAAVEEATADTPPGAERIWLGAEAYLDVCLRERAIKALALEARTDSTLTETMSARHERFAASAIPSIRAMGWPEAASASQLLAAMTSEIAIRELEAGRKLPAARRSLRRFLGLPA